MKRQPKGVIHKFILHRVFIFEFSIKTRSFLNLWGVYHKFKLTSEIFIKLIFRQK